MELVAELQSRHLTLAVAESLTGGLLAAAIVAVPGASTVFSGGVVAYNTALKRSILQVDAALLEHHGPVHPDVAAQMALGVREALAIDGVRAGVGVATTGVAGPGPQDGHPAGTAYVAVALGENVQTLRLSLQGDRGAIRSAVVSESLELLRRMLRADGQ
ncbi:CinA family protein [Glaciihabitans tibetensis]|uniref:CinA family protein n=1 Tax=Glaciihabitans tibetensis TaxID=1266600 RepID=UPI003183AA6B